MSDPPRLMIMVVKLIGLTLLKPLEREKGAGYNCPIMGLFSWLFRKKEVSIDPDSEPQELWQAGGNENNWRWQEEQSEDYALRLLKLGPQLQLHKDHLFAWSINPLFRYRDFVLTAELSFEAPGYAAAGLVFRYMDDGNFYYLLVSNQKRFRVEVVFNSSPMVLIPWTELPDELTEKFEVTIAFRASSIVIAYNGKWAGETSDNTLEKGRIGLAAQTYESAHVHVHLHRITLESREFEIEHRIEELEEKAGEAELQRYRLAESLAAARFFSEAAFQLVALRRRGKLDSKGKLLLSQCWLEEGLHQDALAAVEDILKEGTDLLAVKQKASILYLQSRFLELRDYVQQQVQTFPEDGRLWMFLGHAEHHLSNHESALRAYENWSRFEPQVPFAWLYTGKELMVLSRSQESLPYLSRAAELFFREEAYADMHELLVQLRRLAPESGLLMALEGKAAYLEERWDLALDFFRKSRELGNVDAAVEYLEALIRQKQGEREDAYALCRRACELEPGYDLFWFRAAELAHLLNRPEALNLAQRACELGPRNPWCWNVLGLCHPDPHQKLLAFEKAHQLDPTLEDPQLNLAWQYHLMGQSSQAIKMLQMIRTSRAWNTLGNIYAEQKNWELAEEAYTKAIESNPEFLEAYSNMRLVLKKQGKMGRLDEVLSWLLKRDPNNSEFLLDAADTAFALGDWPRGEIAIQVVLEHEPNNVQARTLLIDHFLAIRRYARVKEEIDKAQQFCPHHDWSTWKDRWLEATHTKLQCASCPCMWYLPNDFPDPGRLRFVGDLPPHLPAGKSPVTGKIYCVDCAQRHLENGRFLCPETHQPLILDKALVYLIKVGLESDSGN